MDWTKLYKNSQNAGLDEASLKENLAELKLEERYQAKELINEGAMKRIYKCKDLFTGREVAYAIPKSSKSAVVESFLREAMITASLQHPNIIPVYDIGLDDDNPFFVMKVIHGHSLADILFKGKRQLSLHALLSIYIKVCEAVNFSHSRGIIHLDLKPDNIQISEYGEVIICDWGLAKVTDWSHVAQDNFLNNEAFYKADTLQATLFGYIKGTPGFMSPEQAQGAKVKKNYSSDIYSLGTILYAILTKKAPIQEQKLEAVIVKTLKGDFSTPRSVDKNIPAALEAICLKAMQTKPEQRYQSVAEIIEEIELYLNNYSPKAEKNSVLKNAYLFSRRKPLFTISLLAFAIILSVISVFTNYLLKDKNVELLRQKKEIEKNLQIVKESKDYLKQISYISDENTHTYAFRRYQSYKFKEANAFLKIVLNAYPDFIKSLDLQLELLIVTFQVDEARKKMEMQREKQSPLYLALKPYEAAEINGKTSPDFFLEYLRHLQKNYLWDFAKKINYNYNRQSAHSEAKMNNIKAILELQSRGRIDNYSWELKDGFYVIRLENNPKLKVVHPLSGLKISKLDISGSDNINFHEFICSKLEILNLSDSQVSHSSIRYFNKVEFPNLDTLILDNVSLRQHHLNDLKKTSIKTLSLRGCKLENYDFLKGITTLKKIILDKTPVNFPKNLPVKIEIIP